MKETWAMVGMNSTANAILYLFNVFFYYLTKVLRLELQVRFSFYN